MQLKFHEVPSAGIDLNFSHTTGELNGLLLDILGDFPNYETKIRVEPLEQMVQVKGQIKCELNLTCSRCAEVYANSFSKNFVTAFYKSEQSLKNFGMHSDDLTGSFDLEFLEGDIIDIGEVVHEQMALEIPYQPLCSEECLGLCFQCGINKNKSRCQCKSEDNNFEDEKSPFSKLKGLMKQKEN
ncbi:MAG: DUF177 domain-containing protein [Oligoflexia bacterium]|nr:DUF177 domain-containing protein [Oligoflexia bacterium]